MRRSHPVGMSIIHIFFRDGLIYFAIIFGAFSLLVCESELFVLTSIGSHGSLVLSHLPKCYAEFGGLGLLVCPIHFIFTIRC